METVHIDQICTPELMDGIIYNDEYHGFRNDYKVLHCLLRANKHVLFRFLEIGTNVGTGTQIICNAIPDARVYSLELPDALDNLSLEYPGERLGLNCKLPFVQLRGNSLEYDYRSVYPIHGAWIDGAHDERHVGYESIAMMAAGAGLIIWHDTDVEGVRAGVDEAIVLFESYKLFYVEPTRVMYAVKD